MSTTEIIKEVKRLPVNKQRKIVELTLKSLRKVEQAKMQQAADVLYTDYSFVNELTSFTALDAEGFL